MFYGGSQVIAHGVRGSFSYSSTLSFLGSVLKGWSDALPRIATDMSVYIYLNNQLFDPFSVKYSVYDPKGNIVKNQQDAVASRFDIGWYYVNLPWWDLVDINQPVVSPGTYRVVWQVYQTQFGPNFSKADDFLVYKARKEDCQASHISTAGNNGIAGAAKQSGTCNTYNYGVGLVVSSTNPTGSTSGCGCA